MQNQLVKPPVPPPSGGIQKNITPVTAAPDGLEELRRLHHSLRQHWLFVALITGVIFMGAVVYSFITTPLYRTQATVEVASQEQTVMHIEDVNKVGLGQLDVMNTLVVKSTRPSVLQRVVALNSLANQAAFRDKKTGQPPSEMQVVGMIAGQVKAQLRRNTRLIDITVEGADPGLAQMIANGVANQFIRQEIEDQGTANRFANAALIEESIRLRNALEESEKKLQVYRENNKSVSLGDRQNIVDQKLHALAQQLNDAKGEFTQLQSQQEQAGQLTNDLKRLESLPIIKADLTVNALQGQIVQQETIVNFYATRYTEKYPKMIEARQRLAELENSLGVAALAASKSLGSAILVLKAKLISLEQAMAAAEQQSLELSRLSINYNILERQMESDRTLYQAVLGRMKETDVAKGIEKTSLQVIEPAGLPGEPFKPKRLLIMAAGLLGGLMLGAGMVFLMEQMGGRIKSVDHAEQALRLPVLAAMPDEVKLMLKNPKCIMMDASQTVMGESFRTLCAALQMSWADSPCRVVMFTSAMSGEGKTTIAANYAAALAQQGIRSVVVDCDLRKNTLSKKLELAPGAPDLCRYLAGNCRLEEIIYPGTVEKLRVIPAGLPMGSPGTLLRSPGFDQFVKELRNRYGMVVLDCPPLLPVADTQSLLAVADGVVLIACERSTPIKVVQRALTLLRRANAPIVGLVINRVSNEEAYYQYKYEYEPVRKK